jgi:hypothetical protein
MDDYSRLFGEPVPLPAPSAEARIEAVRRGNCPYPVVRTAIQSWMQADPVDAANEAEVLAQAAGCGAGALRDIAEHPDTPNRVTRIVRQAL